MNNEQRSTSGRMSQSSHGFGRRPADQPPFEFPTQTGAGGPDLGPFPKAKRARASRSQVVVFLNFVMTMIVLTLVGVGIGLWFGKQQFEAPGPLKESALFNVRKGAGINEIARGLERSGIISDERIFSVGARIDGASAKLKAGEYEIEAGASMRDVLELLKSGKSVLYSLTVPEGLTVKQAFDRIAASAELTGELPAQLPPEGSLVADTQRFARGMDRTELVNKMSAEQKKLIDQIWQSRVDGLPVQDINEFATLASIVEKETGIASERPQVAAVFVNRLRKGMRLQSDPTIIYGIFGGEGKPADRPIYRSDIDKPTPYNTYTIDGLPPGPIAIPGRASLEAVANPAQTNDLFFVADGTGGHVFAETLDEHNRNVARWRKVEADNAVSSGGGN